MDGQTPTHQCYCEQAYQSIIQSSVFHRSTKGSIFKTTFFASTEASMITITAPGSDGTPMSVTAQVANIGIMGALVVHSNAGVYWCSLLAHTGL